MTSETNLPSVVAVLDIFILKQNDVRGKLVQQIVSNVDITHTYVQLL